MDESVPFETRFSEVKTLEQAKNYVLDLVKQVEECRDACNVVFPDDVEATVKYQQKAYRRWMLKYGQTLGALTTLAHVRILNDVAYNELNERIRQTLTPTIVGAISV